MKFANVLIVALAGFLSGCAVTMTDGKTGDKKTLILLPPVQAVQLPVVRPHGYWVYVPVNTRHGVRYEQVWRPYPQRRYRHGW